jgi:hypothetical protein
MMWPRLVILLAIFLSPAVASGNDANGMPDASPDTSQNVSPDIDISRDLLPDTTEDYSLEPPDATDSTSTDAKCREAWQKYRESMACFAPYRVVGGGVKLEAFAHCKNVNQPDLCE